MGQGHWIRGLTRLFLLMAVLTFALPSPLIVAQGTAVFSRVDVAGNQRIEADSIRAFAGHRAGPAGHARAVEPRGQEPLRHRALRGRDGAARGRAAGHHRRENPTINQIAFEGNDSLDDEELNEVIQLRPRLAYSVPAVEADAQRIIEAYRAAGRYAATVDPVIIRQSDNRVDLVFEISEGRRTGVQRVSFSGNQAFSDRRLRRVIETNQTSWLSFALGGNTYDADKLELDRELLRQFYLERGYHRRAGPVRHRRDGARAHRLLPVLHHLRGAAVQLRQRLGQLADPGAARGGLPPLLAPVANRGVYNVKLIDRVIQRMSYQAGQAGYAFVEIRPRVTKNAATRTVDINFELVEGQRVFVERIDISGNTRTLDRVVRRQFHIVEGDAFNSREIRDAEDRINGLGYFKTATVNVRPGTTEDQALVEVVVEEQPTGSLSLGGAFSSSEGLSAQISLTERNFLGRGQTVSGTISASTQFSNYDFGFVEPALFDRDLLAGFNIYYRNTNFDEQSFKTKNVGFEPRLGFPLSENGRLTMRYQISQDDIYDVQDDTSLIIENEEGSLITSAVGATYAYDRRNSVVDPTAGFILTLNQEFAGLGGDTQLLQVPGQGARLHQLLRGGAGALGRARGRRHLRRRDGTRITDRFNTGGDSFRGFARNGLGPRDFCGDDDEPACTNPPQADLDVDDALGGNYYGVLRLDASFPLGLPQEYGVYGGAFADVGSLWQLDDIDGSMGEVDDGFHVRSSVGVSLFIETPFAPLRFNYAIPLQYEDYDVLERFRFTVQTRF